MLMQASAESIDDDSKEEVLEIFGEPNQKQIMTYPEPHVRWSYPIEGSPLCWEMPVRWLQFTLVEYDKDSTHAMYEQWNGKWIVTDHREYTVRCNQWD